MRINWLLAALAFVFAGVSLVAVPNAVAYRAQLDQRDSVAQQQQDQNDRFKNLCTSARGTVYTETNSDNGVARICSTAKLPDQSVVFAELVQ